MTISTDDRPIPTLVSEAVDDVKAILAHERALAQLEVAAAAKQAGAGAGLLVAALGLLGLVPLFLLIAGAEALVAAGLPRWAAYLIMVGIMLLVAALLVGIGVLLLRRVGPPKRAIATTRETVTRTIAQLKTLGRPRHGHVEVSTTRP